MANYEEPQEGAGAGTEGAAGAGAGVMSEEAAKELLGTLQKDFDRIKGQKSRPTGGIEGTTMEALCFLHDEHYVSYQQKTLSLEPREAGKLYLVFNLIQPRHQKLIGRLSAFNAPFKARPNKKDPQALEDAEVVDRMLIALDEKLDETSRLRERLYWMTVGGTAVEYVPWVPNATIEPAPQYSEDGELLWKHLESGEVLPQSQFDQITASGQAPAEAFEIAEEVERVGEVGSEILSPFNVFMDQSVRSIADLAPDQWIHLARPRTVGWIKENFGKDVQGQQEISLISSRINAASGEAAGGIYLKDLLPVIQGSTSSEDMPMVLHVESYQPSSDANPRGRYVCWIHGDQILHADENPYEEIPAVDFHFSPVTTSFWSKGYITPLISPQRFINKRMSQLGEQANAAIYSNILLGGGLKPADIPADFPGVIVNGIGEGGMPNVQRTPPPELPMWFLPSIELALKMFNDAAGGADLMEDNKFPGQLRGPQAVPFLQEIMDTRWGPLFHHLGERIARVKQMRLNRVRQFYPPVRTMHYTDKTQKDEVMTFYTEKTLRSGTNFSVTVERGALLPELRALRESRIVERLNSPLKILYLDERTGQLDKSRIGAELEFGDLGREGRGAVYRKLQREITKMLWEGRQIPPVQPFYDHKVMLDEMEESMATTEFLRASPQIVAAFADRWKQHATFLQAEAQQQQQAMQGQMVHQAVAQATQQAAAQAAADAVTETQEQMKAQAGQPTGEYLAAAQAGQPGGGPRGGDPKPKPKSRKMTFEEKG